MNNLRARVSMVAVAALLLMGMASFVGVSPAAAAFVNGDQVVVFDGSLNLRQSPGLSGTILRVLPDGTALTVTGDPQTVDAIEWYPVVTGSAVNGFVTGQYIMAAPTTTGDFTVGDNIVVADGPLNLRNAAGTSASILKTLPLGATGVVLAGPTAANGMDWYQIQAGSDIGWVAGDFLADDTGGGATGEFEVGDHVFVADGPLNMRSAAGTGSSILTTLPTGTTGTVLAGPTAANGMDWYQIQAASDAGWVAGDFLDIDNGSPSGEFAVNSYVFVDVAKLNLRSTASTSAAVLQTMTDGAVAKVIGGPTVANGYDWYQLDVNGTQGWAVGEYLVGGITVGANAVVFDGPVNLRTSPSSSSSSLGGIPQGATVAITSGPTAGGSIIWFGASYNGQNGYVAGRYLTAP